MAPQRRRSRSVTDQEEPAAEQQPAARRRRATAREEPGDVDEAPAEDQHPAGADADSDGHPRPDGAREDGGRIRTAREAARAALRQLVELTAKPPESITGVKRTNDGWSICFEVVEDRRIPSSADILATYEATIDSDGELMSFHRVRRYSRGRGDGNEVSAK
jgi:hypothetical protein